MIQVAVPTIGKSEVKAVTRVLKSGMLAQGPEVLSFENEFSRLVSDYSCVAVNSGTSALHLALLAAGIGPGDEVIVPSFTFAATANVVRLVGAEPIFVDIDPEFYCISVDDLDSHITDNTKAIIPVHLYGQPADMHQIMSFATKRNLIVIEDAAQAHMATINSLPVGTMGNLGCFSFYPTKNMTSAEGGMVVTANAKYERTIRLLRNQGMEKRYENEIVGLNNRMSDLHAAIGRVQLLKLKERTNKRVKNAEFYLSNIENVVLPKIREGATHVFHQFTILVPGHNRNDFANELLKRGIMTGIYYPTPVHELAPFRQSLDLPVTEFVSKNCLSIPVHPNLSRRNLNHIVSTINLLAGAGA